MKATEQYFHVVLFIILNNVIRTFTFVDKAPMNDQLTNQMKDVE